MWLSFIFSTSLGKTPHLINNPIFYEILESQGIKDRNEDAIHKETQDRWFDRSKDYKDYKDETPVDSNLAKLFQKLGVWGVDIRPSYVQCEHTIIAIHGARLAGMITRAQFAKEIGRSGPIYYVVAGERPIFDEEKQHPDIKNNKPQPKNEEELAQYVVDKYLKGLQCTIVVGKKKIGSTRAGTKEAFVPFLADIERRFPEGKIHIIFVSGPGGLIAGYQQSVAETIFAQPQLSHLKDRITFETVAPKEKKPLTKALALRFLTQWFHEDYNRSKKS